MTDSERELLLLTASVVTGVLRDSYVENTDSVYHDDPIIKAEMQKTNKILLDHMTHMMALMAIVKEPDAALDREALRAYFRTELLESVHKEIERVAAAMTDGEAKELIKNMAERIRKDT